MIILGVILLLLGLLFGIPILWTIGLVVATTPAFLPSTVPSQMWTTTDGATFKAAKLPAGKASRIVAAFPAIPRSHRYLATST